MKRLLVAVLCGATLAACGDEPKTEADKVKDAVNDYAGGIADGDVDEACSHVAGALGETCEQDAGRIASNLEDAKIFADNTDKIINDKEPLIRGDLACIPAGTASFDLQKIDGDWRLIALGRRLDNPKDCLVGLEPAPKS